MENIHERFSWKVWVLILLGLAGLLILFMVLPLIFTPKNQTPSKNSHTVVAPTALPTPTVYSPHYETLQAGPFSISYPSEWTVLKQPIQNTSGLSWELNPVSKSSVKAAIEIQQYSSTNVSFAKLEAIFTELKFSKKDTKISGRPAVIFSGTMPSTPIHNTIMILDNGTTIYKIQGTYSSEKSDPVLESVMNTIIMSFKLTSQ